MTMTETSHAAPRQPALERGLAMRLADTEYRRVVDLLRGLRPEDWQAPTECSGWDVRAMAAHMLGMVDFARSVREQRRQLKLAGRRGGVFIDALTGLQVDERATVSPAQIVAQFASRAPKAARARRRTPAFIRRRPLPVPQRLNERDETWTIGFLVDVIFTRDPWMHRIDIVRATGAEHVLTAEHDGVLVADVVSEWAERHGRPYTLHLSGPAGGSWSAGSGGPEIDMDAVEFCRVLSRRAAGDGLLTTEVPF
jgi:uncharacterized protein (TIGR03083 family)